MVVRKTVLTTASGIHCADASHKTEAVAAERRAGREGKRKRDVKSANKAVITAGRHSCSVSLIRKNFVLL